MRFLLAPIALAGALSFAPPATAQSIPSPYRFIEPRFEAGPLVRYIQGDRGRLGIGPATGLAYGGRFAGNVSNAISLEASASWLPTERNVVNPRVPAGTRVLDDPAEIGLVFIEGSLRFALTGRRTWRSIQPYLAFGGGLSFSVTGDQIEDQRIELQDRYETGIDFIGSFGGGARYLLSPRLALNVDARLRLYQLPIPTGFSDEDLDFGDLPDSEWVESPGFGIGLSFLF